MALNINYITDYPSLEEDTDAGGLGIIWVYSMVLFAPNLWDGLRLSTAYYGL